jgi:Family of unknown function (DUF6132)
VEPDVDVERASSSGGAIEGSGAWRRLARSHVRTAVAGALGAAAGAAYAYFVGCRTGTCPITSSVWMAGTYGLVVGAIAGWPARSR